MEEEKLLISISFKVLLHAICSYCGFPPPVFHRRTVVVHNAYVLVLGPNELHAFVYFNGDCGSFDESVERASKKWSFFGGKV